MSETVVRTYYVKVHARLLTGCVCNSNEQQSVCTCISTCACVPVVHIAIQLLSIIQEIYSNLPCHLRSKESYLSLRVDQASSSSLAQSATNDLFHVPSFFSSGAIAEREAILIKAVPAPWGTNAEDTFTQPTLGRAFAPR